MKLLLNIDDKRIHDLLHGHGGRMSPWMQSLTGVWNESCVVKFDKETDAEGEFTGRKRVGPIAVKKGLAAMALGSPYQFGQFLEENDDDVTFDTAWQWIIFGKLVYA